MGIGIGIGIANLLILGHPWMIYCLLVPFITVAFKPHGRAHLNVFLSKGVASLSFVDLIFCCFSRADS
jgi:hypothetical protein